MEQRFSPWRTGLDYYATIDQIVDFIVNTRRTKIVDLLSDTATLALRADLPFKTLDDILKAKEPIMIGSAGGPSDSNTQFILSLEGISQSEHEDQYLLEG
jgi:hypothetical protein